MPWIPATVGQSHRCVVLVCPGQGIAPAVVVIVLVVVVVVVVVIVLVVVVVCQEQWAGSAVGDGRQRTSRRGETAMNGTATQSSFRHAPLATDNHHSPSSSSSPSSSASLSRRRSAASSSPAYQSRRTFNGGTLRHARIGEMSMSEYNAPGGRAKGRQLTTPCRSNFSLLYFLPFLSPPSFI